MNDEVQYTIVGDDGKEYGPMDLETLQDMVRDDRVGAETRVWDSTTKEWHDAVQIEELSEFFPEEIVEQTPEPPPIPAVDYAPPSTSAWALASMWCGIASAPTFFCGGWVLGVLAVVFGFIGRSEVRSGRYEGGHYATAGVICGLVTLGLTVIIGVAFGPFFVDALKQFLTEYK
jgi:hypothetical protein